MEIGTWSDKYKFFLLDNQKRENKERSETYVFLSISTNLCPLEYVPYFLYLFLKNFERVFRKFDIFG